MNRYHHDDYLAAAGMDMWSRFRDLADKADMLYEREGVSKDRKSVSEEEEKTRFSILVDYVGMLCDEEERRILGSSPTETKTLFDDSEKSLLDHLPQKPRSSLEYFFTRVYTRRNNETLNRVSASSSLFNTAEFERTETKSPPNPNLQSSPSSCLMENTKRKRYQRRSSGKSKKAKVDPLSQTAREAPEWLFDMMRKMKEAEGSVRLIYRKTLTASDVKPSQSRLLIPFSQLLRNDFLTPEESQAIGIDKEEEDDNNNNIGMRTIVVDKLSKEWALRFKICVMKKKSGKRTLNYALNRGWNNVVSGNKLKEKDTISLWTFRCGEDRCFALEKE